MNRMVKYINVELDDVDADLFNRVKRSLGIKQNATAIKALIRKAAEVLPRE